MTEDRSDELREWYAEDEIDGAELLDEVHATLERYVVFPDRHSAVAVTLWIATTHALHAFECAARLVITSPENRCGKTRLLDIICGTCHRPLATVDATIAAVFRSLGGDHPPTLILDEADGIFGSKKAAENNEDLRKMLNAGISAVSPQSDVSDRCRSRLTSTCSRWPRSPGSAGCLTRSSIAPSTSPCADGPAVRGCRSSGPAVTVRSLSVCEIGWRPGSRRASKSCPKLNRSCRSRIAPPTPGNR
jgi:hypothetical protein